MVTSGLIADALVLMGTLQDWRTRGRRHSAWVVGGVVLVAVQLLQAPMSTT